GDGRSEALVDVLGLLVLGQPGRTELTAEPGLLEAAPLSLRQVRVVVVDPDRAVAQTPGDALCATCILRPHGTGETVDRVVRGLDGFFFGLERLDGDDGAEGLVAHDGHSALHLVEDRRQIIEAVCEVALRRFPAGAQSCALRDAGL